jgi:hypothetical protein
MCQPHASEQSGDCCDHPSIADERLLNGIPPRSHSLSGSEYVAEIIGRDMDRQIELNVNDVPMMSRVLTPFVVQHGPQLFMLASESAAWVLAELRFDDETCTFAELRRVRYAWPREAYGALLSRIAVAGCVDTELVEQTTDEFSNWLASQFRTHGGIGRG